MRRFDGDPGDPAVIYERKQSSSCHACSNAATFLDVKICTIGRTYGRRCEKFQVKRMLTLEEKLKVWADVVNTRDGAKIAKEDRAAGGYASEPAFWAKIGCALRDAANGQPRAVYMTPDQEVAWEVERAWRALPMPVMKWVLKYHYVWNMGAGQIESKMYSEHGIRMRRQNFGPTIESARHHLHLEMVRLAGSKNFA